MKALVIFTLTAASMLVACQSAALPSPTSQPTALPTQEAATGSTGTVINTPAPQPADAATVAAPGGRSAVFPKTIVVYQREGGSASGLQQWTFYQTGRILAVDGTERQIPAERAQLLFSLAEAPDYWELKDAYAPTGECSGCLAHTITVYREGKIKKITVTQGADLPENLIRLLGEIQRPLAR